MLWDPAGEGNDPWSHARISDEEPEIKDERDEGAIRNGVTIETSKSCSGAGFSEIIYPCVLAVHSGIRGSVLMCAPGTGLRSFTFDSVFGEKAQQIEIYLASAQRLVVSFLNGQNACVLAYGQTGSGKTHTMFGRMSPSDDPALQGVVPRAVREVLQGVRFKQAVDLETRLSVSYVEIYGEQVHVQDLSAHVGVFLLTDGCGR